MCGEIDRGRLLSGLRGWSRRKGLGDWAFMQVMVMGRSHYSAEEYTVGGTH